MEGDTNEKLRMNVAGFFTALASNEDFIFAVAHTNSFKKGCETLQSIGFVITG